jgi:hypothetical protein
MYFSEIKKRPDLDESSWGQHADPFVQYDPIDYADRFFPVPLELRGRHQYRAEPRQLGPGAAYLPDYSAARTMPAYGEHPDDQKWGFIILLGVVGLIAFLAGSSHGAAKAKRNFAKRNGRRRRASTDHRRVARKTARSLPRDDAGRFLPAGS